MSSSHFQIATELMQSVQAEMESEVSDVNSWLPIRDINFKDLGNDLRFLSAELPDCTLWEGCVTQIRQRNNIGSIEIISVDPVRFHAQFIEPFELNTGELEIRIPTRTFLQPAEQFLGELVHSLEFSSTSESQQTHAFDLVAPAQTKGGKVNYLIGAPGTGKTEWLIKEALQHANRSRRVLIATYTNVAADSIFQRIASAIGQDKSNKLLRYGFTEKSMQVSEAAENPYIHNSRELEHFQCAEIVITTAHRVAALASKLESFDHVLIDEASSMPLPLAFIVAYQASRQVCAIGDPFQLAPISLQREKSTDNKDQAMKYSSNVFDVGDIFQEIISKRLGHILETQHRLPLQIQEIAFPPVYKTNSAYTANREQINSALGSGSVLYVDTSALDARCQRTGQSRENSVHAIVTVEAVRSLLEQSDIAADTVEQDLLIITPYRRQRARIRRAITETGWFEAASVQRIVTTVHQAQGIERKFVIIDTTESPASDFNPSHQIGQLWRGRDWRSRGYRMLYVAMTRSTYQVLIVINRSYLAKKQVQTVGGIESLARLNWQLDLHGAASSLEFHNQGETTSQPGQ